MDLEDALETSKDFIIQRLNARAGTIQPTFAEYVDSDEEEGIWIIKYKYKEEGRAEWTNVTIKISDESKDVISFEVK